MFGAVVFDDDKRPAAGWASVKGKEAFRVRGTGDLASDIIWWTNLDGQVFFAFGGLSAARMKRSEYLKPNMTQLHAELGLEIVRMPASRIAEITAEVFDRVMRLAQEHYGLDRPGDRTLAEDLFAKIVREDKPITPEIDEALAQAYQAWVSCETAAPTGSKYTTFRRPRIAHSLDVLMTPTPGEQWEFVDAARLPPESRRIDWLLAQNRPALVKASVKRVEHDVAPVIAFGGGQQKERSWMSHPELLYMSKFAKLKVEAAFLGAGYVPQKVYSPPYTGAPVGVLSISVGIVMENYCVALSIARSYRRFKNERMTIHSPRAVWFAASDRFHSLIPALMMHGSGFTVRGYGRGSVMLALQRGALRDARACAAAAGLLAPLNLNEDIAVQTALAS